MISVRHAPRFNFNPPGATWRSTEGRDVRVEDMTASHIGNAVKFLQRQAHTKRAMADCGALDELEADQYLTWAQSWLKVFQEELERRTENPFLSANDQRVTAEDVQSLFSDPGEVDDAE